MTLSQSCKFDDKNEELKLSIVFLSPSTVVDRVRAKVDTGDVFYVKSSDLVFWRMEIT